MPGTTDLILDEKKIDRALQRIAHEIVERNAGAESLVIIGVLRRGAYLARRIAKMIEELEGVKVPVGLMDISLYRDDVHSKLDQPIVQRTEILFDVVNRNVVLIDDVLFTGRTTRAAIDQVIDFGRPKTIQLAVLVDRGHRELPFRPDYVGANIPTAREDQVVLEVKEKEGVDRVYVIRGVGDKSRPAGTTAAAGTSGGRGMSTPKPGKAETKPAAKKKAPAKKTTKGKGKTR